MQPQKPYQSSVLWTLSMILVLSFCFLATMFTIQEQAEDSCYAAIEASTDQAVYALNVSLQERLDHLQIIADILVLEDTPTPETLEMQMEYLCSTHDVDVLYLRMADGFTVQIGSPLPDFSALPPLGTDTAAPYISDLFPGQTQEEKFLYCAVPLIREGKAVGMLYGFLSLDRLPGIFDATVYGGNYQLFLVDGTTGDFLMNTWNGTLYNLYDGSMGSLDAKTGYDIDVMLSDVRSGRSGYMVFRSRETGDNYYTRYQPAGINNWSVQLILDEDTAFANTARINRTILTLAVIVVMLTGCYLLGIMIQQKRASLFHKRQLLRSSYMYEVQQILFDSYKDPGRITDALEKVCRTLDAGAAVLLTVEGTHIHLAHIWEAIPTTLLELIKSQDLETAFPSIFQHIAQEKSLILYEEDFSRVLSPQELEIMDLTDVHSIMLAPVVDIDGVLRGTLFAVDMGQRLTDCSLLECVAHDFMMALRSVVSYQLVRDMGLVDHLTGLKSRNSYDSALASYSAVACQNMHCIFIDVNGLHEVNNHFGHSAGDAMLKAIAGEITKLFDRDHAYRIGGDEFVVFVINGEEEQVTLRTELLRDNLRLSDYHISIGRACQAGHHLNLERLVSDAEVLMYRDKRKFYEETGRDKGISLRLKNSGLEQLLQEQRDNDALMSLLNTCFRGIYAVNLNTDDGRSLGQYDQFTAILEDKNYRFLKACREYVPQIMEPSQVEAFFRFCDYSRIMEELSRGQMPVHRFQTQAGEAQLLRIYASPEFSSQEPSTYWLFERIHNP